ncbi:39S ribosomal protein L51, mitochondrial [Aphelenchoides besseyi]|nr:39S ribosomal protein L51, mitochondrial [Aphelenchoides besseyi]KAI6237202.1 39S ribosomal protein L51, mitochondrial [Aphelenchoides besseyi]
MNLLKCCDSQLAAIQRCGRRPFHDYSQVPRISDDAEKQMHKPRDTGYYYRYHRKGVDALPRIPDCKEKVFRPAYRVRTPWNEDQAQFGAFDYVDLLKPEANVHPAQLQYHVPRWLRGFPGQHRANELIKLIHYRNLYKEKMQRNSPHQWHQLCKRIKYLLQYHNYRKQDEIGEERSLGLWEQEPDYFYKDKSRRSYKDLI